MSKTGAHAPSQNSDISLDQAVAMMAPLTALVVRAGAAILAINQAGLGVAGKADGSPVTEADLAADRIIADELTRLYPAVPLLSEERADRASAPFAGNFFLVDPLDGTKEFISGRKEFTVNIALVANGVPVFGLVGAPALGLIWRGVVGRGAERVTIAPDGEVQDVTDIRTRSLPAHGAAWIAAVSRSHGDARTEGFIAARPGAVRQELGSAVKFCRVAEGGADIYPRLAPTCEWDVAAGHAVLVAAGGAVTDSRGAPIRYGHRTDFIVSEFIAWGDPAAAIP